MKKAFLIFLIPLINLNAQWDFSLSMGLDFKAASSYRDYINSAPGNDNLSTFTNSVNFAGEVDYMLSPNLEIGIEHSLAIDSYNRNTELGGVYEISYTHQRPTALCYYVIAGKGYKFKFGGGIGLRFVSLTERIIAEADYTASGFGILLKAEGNTLLSDNFYALIGVDLRYDLPGELKSANGSYIVNQYTNEKMNLNSLSIGIKLGIAYLL